MKLLRKRRNPALEPKERATGHLFCQLFTNEMTGLYLLALLATANAEAAEQCFISSLDGCLSGVAVKNEWAHAWAKRVVIKNAIRLVVGTHVRDIQAVSTISDESGARVWREKVANPGIGNVLALEDFERLVFVMSVLERYSDRDVAALLECSDDEVQKARIRAFGRIEA